LQIDCDLQIEPISRPKAATAPTRAEDAVLLRVGLAWWSSWLLVSWRPCPTPGSPRRVWVNPSLKCRHGGASASLSVAAIADYPRSEASILKGV